MIDILTIVYLVYSFIAFYFLFLYGLIYAKNRKEFFSSPPLTKNYSLSMVVPCFNASKHIGETIETLAASDYKGLKKIIVVDDCSTDDSYKVAKSYEKKYPGLVQVVQTPKNTGNAAGAKNYGAQFVNTTLIGFSDDDSDPSPDAIRKMIGFFDDEKIAAVTSSVLVKYRNTILEKLQAIEYKIIIFTRKLLGFVDAIYVTPGPLAIYSRKAFEKVGGFDEENLTEDIEIVWNFVNKGYKIGMSVPAKVYTAAPRRFKPWYRQRLRWNVGGMQTIFKYKKDFLRTGMLGSFILPFFTLSWLLGILGISILIYRVVRRVIVQYLAAKSSIAAQTTILALREINLTPNVLVFFGTAILILSLSFTLLALSKTKEESFKSLGIIGILVFALVYLLAYPFILVVSLSRFIRGKREWYIKGKREW